jgi:hypothetical protein
LYRKLLVASEIFRQQKDHIDSIGRKGRHIENRIVSISKPHVRPIERGKAGAEIEFGAKVSVSVIEGNVFLHRLSWDAYHDGGDLKMQASVPVIILNRYMQIRRTETAKIANGARTEVSVFPVPDLEGHRHRMRKRK